MMQKLYENGKQGAQQADEYFLFMERMIRTRFEINGCGYMKEIPTNYSE